MSSINVNTIKSRLGGPPTLPSGVVVSAAATFSTDVSIGGTLTYEDVTNVDAVGLITARNGIKFGVAGVGGTIRANGDTTLAGVVTATSFSGDGSALTGMANTANVNTADLRVVGVATIGVGLTLADNVHARFGNAGDLKIYHGSDNNSYIKEGGSGNLYIYSENLRIENADGSKSYIEANNSGAVEVYYDGTKKLETTAYGGMITDNDASAELRFTSSAGRVGSVWGNSDTTFGLLDGQGHYLAAGTKDAEFSLYYDNAVKLATLSTGVKVTGITSTASLTVGPGIIQEKFYNQGSALTGTYNHDLNSDGMVLYAYNNASASFILNVRGDASTTLNSLMHIGQTSVFTAYTGSNNTSYYMTDFKIDGASQTEEWNGGTAPTAGTGSGYDVYTFNILKTADATFKVFATFSNFN